ncbi:MAG: ion channel [Cellulosilyticaceae bacterium]
MRCHKFYQSKKFWRNMSKNKLSKWIKWLMAPTLYISDTYKSKAKSKEERGRRVKCLNKTYVTISCILTLLLAFCPKEWAEMAMVRGVLVVWALYVFSRCNEIFMAFVKDVFDKLNAIKRDKNGLEYFERIQLALRSYVELVLNYSMLYYLMDHCGKWIGMKGTAFNQVLANMWDSIYFSVVTIASIGYGDYFPIHPLSKALVMYEVINGTLLLVVSFTVYVNLTLSE